MPTYPYRCTRCSHEFDAFQKITDAPLITCPHCAEDALKRGIGGGSALFQFKGDGFYLTDYKSKQDSSCCPCGEKKSCDTK